MLLNKQSILKSINLNDLDLLALSVTTAYMSSPPKKTTISPEFFNAFMTTY